MYTHSTPITVCWYQVELQSSNDDDIKPFPLPSPDGQYPVEECVIFKDSNSTIYRENRTFNVVGNFLFVARFCNVVSEVKINLTIHVVPGELYLRSISLSYIIHLKLVGIAESDLCMHCEPLQVTSGTTGMLG